MAFDLDIWCDGSTLPYLDQVHMSKFRVTLGRCSFYGWKWNWENQFCWQRAWKVDLCWKL